MKESVIRLWVIPGAVWVALLMLLAATVASAYIPLGAFNTVLNMAIAAMKVALIAVFFMKLRSSKPLVRLVSVAGIFWLILMFSLTAGDYLMR
jgi:cytochrome c oxidase subunit 4